MSGGAVTLGEIAGRLSMLEVVWSRCDRRGRLSVAKLIDGMAPTLGCRTFGKFLLAITYASALRRPMSVCGVHIRN